MTIIIVIASLSSFSETKDTLILTGSVNNLSPADTNYSGIYEENIMLPEFAANLKIYGDLFVWAAYSSLEAEGTTPVFGGDAKSSQNFIFFGAAYRLRIIEDLKILIKLGAGSISYQEEALDITIKNSILGFYVDSDLFFDITDYFSLFASAGYISGKDTVNDVDIKLGGFKAGGGIAINF
jgi:hypothetical protein